LGFEIAIPAEKPDFVSCREFSEFVKEDEFGR
jgi:hypothetical protein